MITMQLTPTDIADAKLVVDAANQRGDLTAPQVGILYDAIVVAMSQVGTVFDLVPSITPSVEPPLLRRRLQRRKKAIKP